VAEGDRRPRWVEAALEEYKAHRAEVLATVQGQHSSLAFGTAAIGILAAGAFNVWDDRFVSTVVFLVAIPFLTAVVLAMWFAQVIGMLRVGVYLEGLEGALKAQFESEEDEGVPASVLAWEAGIREGRSTPWQPRYDWHHFAVVVMFAVLGVASIVLGAYRGFALRPTLVSVVAAVEIALLGAFLSVVIYELATGRRSAREALQQEHRR
jgi:hypothetical protein